MTHLSFRVGAVNNNDNNNKKKDDFPYVYVGNEREAETLDSPDPGRTFILHLSFPPPPGFTVGSLIGLIKRCGGTLLSTWTSKPDVPHRQG